MYEELKAGEAVRADGYREQRTGRQKAEHELALMRSSGAQPAPPAPPASENGGPAFVTPGINLPAAPAPVPPQPVPPPQVDISAARKEVEDFFREQYGDDYVRANAKQLELVATEVSQAALATFQQQMAPFAAQLNVVQQQQQATLIQSSNQQFDAEMAGLNHADWEQKLAQPEFDAWLQTQQMGREWYTALFPQRGQSSGTAGLHAHVLDLFETTHPQRVAAAAQSEEEVQRAAAAAATSHGDVHAMPPGVPAEQETLYMSQILREGAQLQNNPQELIAFNKRVSEAQAQGRVVDDFNQPMGGQAPPVP